VHRSISFAPLTELIFNEESIESVFIEISKNPSCNITPNIGVIYKPPNADIQTFIAKMIEILNKLRSTRKHCYIMGDFNLDLILHETNANTKMFLDLMHSHAFFPLIDKPTRITATTSTLIDNIFSNVINHTHLSDVLYTDISDHLPLFTVNQFICRNNSIVTKTIEYRSFNETNKLAFQNALLAIDWEELFTCHNCEAAYTLFTSNFVDCYNESFPIKSHKINPKQNPPWLSPELKRSINRKKSAL
jgi:hypothetical protein